MFVTSAPRTLPTSRATAGNTSAGGSPWAISVATGATRPASSASRRSSSRPFSSWARPSAFAIAVPTSSVKPTRCSSASGRETFAPRPDADRAPQPPLNHDRRRDPDRSPSRRMASPDALEFGCSRSLRPGGRCAGPPPWPRAAQGSSGFLSGTRRGVRRRPATRGRRVIGIETGDERGVGTEDLADLPRDGREDLGRRYPAGNQRGDPAQGGLLVGRAGGVPRGSRRSRVRESPGLTRRAARPTTALAAPATRTNATRATTLSGSATAKSPRGGME